MTPTPSEPTAQTIDELQREFNEVLRRTQRKRNMFIAARAVCYALSIVYIAGMLIIHLIPGIGISLVHDYTANPNPTFWEANKVLIFILPIIFFIMLGSVIMGKVLPRLTEARYDAFRKIIRRLFPDASFYLESRPIDPSALNDTLLFNPVQEEEYSGSPQALATINFNTGRQKTTVRDLGIFVDNKRQYLINSPLGGLFMFFNVMRTAFSTHEEADIYRFRGMWAQTILEKTLNGGVIVLPDHLEEKVGYLAQTFQSLTTKHGCKPVRMEDVEFEKRFAVYATDDFLARYILTPFVMQRLCELRDRYDRDIMVSFAGNTFNFAMPMPHGMFSTARGEKNTVVSDLYTYLKASTNLLAELRLHWNINN